MLSPPQRPLSCCVVRKGGRGPGEGEKTAARGESFPARPAIIQKMSHREPLWRREVYMYIREDLAKVMTGHH